MFNNCLDYWVDAIVPVGYGLVPHSLKEKEFVCDNVQTLIQVSNIFVSNCIPIRSGSTKNINNCGNFSSLKAITVSLNIINNPDSVPMAIVPRLSS